MINFTLTENEINQYKNGQPFPHIVIDNFLNPSLIKPIVKEFNDFQNWGYDNSDYSKNHQVNKFFFPWSNSCLLYTSPSPRDGLLSRMPSSA